MCRSFEKLFRTRTRMEKEVHICVQCSSIILIAIVPGVDENLIKWPQLRLHHPSL